jgi:hypothetical protein
MFILLTYVKTNVSRKQEANRKGHDPGEGSKASSMFSYSSCTHMPVDSIFNWNL